MSNEASSYNSFVGCTPSIRLNVACVGGYEHGNDFVFYSAVAPDSWIAVLWHFFFGIFRRSTACNGRILLTVPE